MSAFVTSRAVRGIRRNSSEFSYKASCSSSLAKLHLRRNTPSWSAGDLSWSANLRGTSNPLNRQTKGSLKATALINYRMPAIELKIKICPKTEKRKETF